MTPDKGESKAVMDERLVEARVGALVEGEEVVAEEAGDQGQAVVLTNSRVLIIKAGLTATGELNGKRVSAYPLESITSVNVRKGPLGAVIQICCEGGAPDGSHDNIVVFTGAQRIKKCEAIAARISEAVGKPVSKVEPEHDANKAQTPQPERERKSLAQEMYDEMNQPQAEPVAQDSQISHEEPVAPEPVMVIEAEPEPEQHVVQEPTFRPNPNLPKPVARRRGGMGRLIAVLGVLGLLAVAGVSVIGPIKNMTNSRPAKIDLTDITSTAPALRQEHEMASTYLVAVTKIIQESNRGVAAVAAALRSSDWEAASAAARSDVTDAAWRKLADMAAPSGLAGAKDSLESGLFLRKTVVASVPDAGQPCDASTVQEALREFAQADAEIKKGLDAISGTQESLMKQISGAEAKSKPKGN